MQQRPPVPPPERRRTREQTQRGGYDAPGPAIRESGDDPVLAAELEAERERSAALLSELESTRRSRDALSQARARSISPPPSMRAIQIEREDPTLPSIRPGRDIVINVLRLAGSKAWLVMIVGLVLWQLPAITSAIKEIRASASAADVQALRTELAAVKTELGRLRTAATEARKDEIVHRSHLSQVLEHQGIQWPLAAGAEPTTAIRTEAPIRRPGVVTRGPSLIVQTPMTLPPAVPSAAP